VLFGHLVGFAPFGVPCGDEQQAGYSPEECVEGEFCELGVQVVLGSWC